MIYSTVFNYLLGIEVNCDVLLKTFIWMIIDDTTNI